jgi:hypothetical protein
MPSSTTSSVVVPKGLRRRIVEDCNWRKTMAAISYLVAKSNMTEFEKEVFSEVTWKRMEQSAEWMSTNGMKESIDLYWSEYIQGCSMGKEV